MIRDSGLLFWTTCII